MTVAELIEVLSKMPQDAAVWATAKIVVGAEHDEFFNIIDLILEGD